MVYEDAFVPVDVTDETVNDAFPVLVSVNTSYAAVEPTLVFANMKLAGDTDTAAPTPVPEIATDCGDPLALSAICTDAERLPTAVGVKAASKVQLAPAATVVQV